MNNDTHPYKKIVSKIVYKNPWIRVREDKITKPDGTEGIYSVVETHDSVVIVVLNEKNEIYLVNTYRYPDQSWHWELPGGGGEGEDAMAASKRELVEETGITAEDWTLLGKTRVCNGLMTERQVTYLARNLTMTDRRHPDDEAIVSGGEFYSVADIHKMVQEEKINDGQTIASLYLAEQWLIHQEE